MKIFFYSLLFRFFLIKKFRIFLWKLRFLLLLLIKGKLFIKTFYILAIIFIVLLIKKLFRSSSYCCNVICKIFVFTLSLLIILIFFFLLFILFFRLNFNSQNSKLSFKAFSWKLIPFKTLFSLLSFNLLFS